MYKEISHVVDISDQAIKPIICFKRVDLPAPLCPIRAVILQLLALRRYGY